MALAEASKRPMPPALYNPARLLEKPIPQAEFTIDAVGGEDDHANNDLDTTFFDSGEFNGPIEQLNNSGESNGLEEIDVKPVIDDEDLIAFELLFDDNESTDSETADNDLLAIHEDQQPTDGTSKNSDLESFGNGIRVESTRVDGNEKGDVAAVAIGPINANDENGAPLNENVNGRLLKTIDDEETVRNKEISANLEVLMLLGQKVVVSDDVEYVHIPSQQLKPIEDEPEYEVKANDFLCGNKPFKAYVIPFFKN